MKDFENFVAWRPHTRSYTKIDGPRIWSTTDSVVYMADGKVYKRFLDAAETSVPVTEQNLRSYHKIHKILSSQSFRLKIPFGRLDLEIRILPLEQQDILVSPYWMLSSATFINWKTLTEESIPFSWKFGLLWNAVASGITQILTQIWVVVNTHDSYVHPTNVKVGEQDRTKLTITDLGSKIPAFVKRNGHLAQD